MKRKVNRVGKNTLTVSLPAKWAKQNKISPGDELTVQEIGKALNISKDPKYREGRRIFLNIDDFCKLMLNRFVQEFYLEGAEEIVLKFNKETIRDNKKQRPLEIDRHINKLVDRFIGMEIVSKTKNRIVLESLISSEEISKKDIVGKRVFFLVKEFLCEFLEAMDEDFERFHSKTYDYHDNIAKFTYYYMRLVHFSNMRDDLKSRTLTLYVIIDKMIDKIRHTSEKVAEMEKITPKTKRLLKEIFTFFLEQFKLVFKKVPCEEIKTLVSKRYQLVRKVNKGKYSEEEMKVLAECKILLDTINDFTSSYAALNADKYINEV